VRQEISIGWAQSKKNGDRSRKNKTELQYKQKREELRKPENGDNSG